MMLVISFSTWLIVCGYFKFKRPCSIIPAITSSHIGPLSSTSYNYHTHHEFIEIDSLKGICLVDITPQIRETIKKSGVVNGMVNVLSLHTTTAITINEMESRLVDDTRQFLLKLAPPDYPYLHNDLHVRKGPPGWPGGDDAWRAQEPINAHSHLLTMILGSSETLPINDSKLVIGTWQSVIMVEMDGPRKRKIAIQINGGKLSNA
eukprot:gene6654-9135_t